MSNFYTLFFSYDNVYIKIQKEKSIFDPKIINNNGYMRGIKNILFDMGGVLIDIERQSCVDAFLKLGFSNIDQYLGDYGQKGAFLQLEEGSISENQFYELIRDEIPEATNEEIAHAFTCFITGMPENKLQMIEDLKSQGYRVMLLSNTNPIIFPFVCDKYFKSDGKDVNHYFEKLFLSYELGSTKPDPNIFRELIKRSGTMPEETLFIDDSQDNLDAAAQFGFETYLAKQGADFSDIFIPKVINV